MLPACAGADSATCPLLCAEVLLPVAVRCKHAVGFNAALGGVGLKAACYAASEQALAGAPATVTISGLCCHPEHEGEHVLQPVLINAQPHWVKTQALASGRTARTSRHHHLYWTPPCGSTGAAEWLLGDDTSGDAFQLT